jgi:hypothetical protein
MMFEVFQSSEKIQYEYERIQLRNEDHKAGLLSCSKNKQRNLFYRRRLNHIKVFNDHNTNF